MKEGLLIYGCYGYTGKIISEYAVKCGLKPVLAGRDGVQVRALANELNLSYLVFDLTQEQDIVENISTFKVVLHCAGPFMSTARKMACACIKARTHYLDITGEYEVFEQLFSMDEEAKNAGVLLLPGVGFDVVPTDCLAMHLKDKLPSSDSLEMVLHLINGNISSGTSVTILENIDKGCAVRRNGKIEKTLNGELTRVFDYGGKKLLAAAIPWGDISTAYRTTGIPNITVYLAVPPYIVTVMKLSNYFSSFLKPKTIKENLARLLKKLPAGPDVETRSKSRCVIWGEVKNSSGKIHRAVLEIPETYTITALTSVKIAQNILANEPTHGTKTPSQVFGKDFILQFEGVNRIDID